ncbi:MAG: Rho termination factor N-terminal domain-containing protein, partial [Thermoanaerobaculia bacterium]
MPEQEIENEATAVEVPPATEEKPKRARKPRAPKATNGDGDVAAAPAEAKDAGEGVAVAESVAEEAAPENGNGSAVAEPESESREPKKAEQLQYTGETLDIRGLKEMKLPDLSRVAKELGVENATGMRKQDLIFAVLQA